MRFAAGLCPDLLGELQRSPRPPCRYSGRGERGREINIGREIGREERGLGK